MGFSRFVFGLSLEIFFWPKVFICSCKCVGIVFSSVGFRKLLSSIISLSISEQIQFRDLWMILWQIVPTVFRCFYAKKPPIGALSTVWRVSLGKYDEAGRMCMAEAGHPCHPCSVISQLMLLSQKYKTSLELAQQFLRGSHVMYSWSGPSFELSYHFDNRVPSVIDKLFVLSQIR